MQKNCISALLQDVDPKSYPKRDMEKRFVFYKTEIKNRVEFESALYPNWYISSTRSLQLNATKSPWQSAWSGQTRTLSKR